MFILKDLLRVFVFSVASLVALFFLTKMIGNRQVSQLSLFDYINGITIGSIAAEMATSLEGDALQPLLAMVIFAGATFVVSLINNKSLKFRRFSMGKPLVLMEDGKIYEKNLAKARLDLSELLMQLRGIGYFSIDDAQVIVMEPNGKISVLPRAEKRPVTPMDLNLAPRKAEASVNVVMDGILLETNLQYTGYTAAWLNKQLQHMGITEVEHVFLATLNKRGDLSVYLNLKSTPEPDIFS